MQGIKINKLLQITDSKGTVIEWCKDLPGKQVTIYHRNAGIIFGENRDISASVNLKNILDVNYGEEYGFPMAGRTICAGLDWRYTKK